MGRGSRASAIIFACIACCGALLLLPSGSQTLDSRQVPLAPGWNLISLPLAPSDRATGAVLASVSGGYSTVFSYDSSTASRP